MDDTAYIQNMTDVELIKARLIEMGMDGLYCPVVPCGCRLDDLAPCDCEDFLEAMPGKLIEFTAEDDCGCEGQGTAHWHIGSPEYVAKLAEKRSQKGGE